MANEVLDLVAANNFVYPRFHKITHLCKFFANLVQTLDGQILVYLSDERDVGLEVHVEVANVDKGPEDIRREDQLEGLPILFN